MEFQGNDLLWTVGLLLIAIGLYVFLGADPSHGTMARHVKAVSLGTPI